MLDGPAGRIYGGGAMTALRLATALLCLSLAGCYRSLARDEGTYCGAYCALYTGCFADCPYTERGACVDARNAEHVESRLGECLPAWMDLVTCLSAVPCERARNYPDGVCVSETIALNDAGCVR